MQGHNVRIEPTARTVPDRPTDPPEVEPRACETCYHFEPCPCGRCGWGVCCYSDSENGCYVSDCGTCDYWEEA